MSDYAQIPTNLICRFGELSKTEIVVVSYLYASRNRKTGQCNPSRAAIGRAVGVDRAHVGRAVESLESKEWIFEMAEGGWTLFPDPPIVAESATVAKSAHVQNPQPDVAKSATDPCEIRNTLNKDFSEQKKEQKKEQREEREPAAADFAPPQNVPSEKSLFGHPVIEALRIVTKKCPPIESRKHLIDKVDGHIDLAKLQIRYGEWRARGYKDTNFDGILDWYLGNKNGNGKPNYQKRTDADVLAESKDFYDQYPS